MNNPHNEGTDKEEEIKFWIGKYEKQRTPYWHMADVNMFLVKYFDQYCCNEGSCKVLVPFCGKTLDMIWLAKKGCDVVGVELCQIPCEDFFRENNLTYTIKHIKDARVYKCKELSVEIYLCDFLNFPSVYNEDDKFDFVWDRGGIVALEIPHRKRYCDVIFKLLGPNGSYLAETFGYDVTKYVGPPYNVTPDILKENFGEAFEYTVLENHSWQDKLTIPNIDEYTMYIHLVRFKVTRDNDR